MPRGVKNVRCGLLADDGQATVEAAVLLPVLLALMGLLLQPACLLYTRAVMSAAVGEGARVAQTSSSATEVEEYVRRRLRAVPNVALFHVGEDDGWEVEVKGIGKECVTVTARTHARPLPLTYAVAAAIGGSDAEGVRLEASASRAAHPTWVGGDYGDWVGIWG